jgi:hypothetical protein
MEKPFPVISEDASIEDIAHNIDHATPAIPRQACRRIRHHHEVRPDFFLTKQKGEK